MTNTEPQSETLQAETVEYLRLTKLLESAHRHPSDVPEWIETRLEELEEILYPDV